VKITKSQLKQIIKEEYENWALGIDDVTAEGAQVSMPEFIGPEGPTTDHESVLSTFIDLWNGLNELLVAWEAGRPGYPGESPHDELKNYQEQLQRAMKDAAAGPDGP